MADNKCQYQIKAKYNGVYGYSNSELTNKKAEKLAKEHAKGHDLFSVLPEKIQEQIDEKQSIEAREHITKVESETKEKRQAHKKKIKLKDL